jgi:hypothetical protein
MLSRLLPSTRWRNVLIVSISTLLSIGWIIVSAYLQMESAGGRGGAIAVAISFYFLFNGGDAGRKVYEALTEDKPNIETRVNAIISWLDTSAADTVGQNWYLAWSSVLGTFAWGFGDIAARHVPLFALNATAYIGQYIPFSTFLLKFIRSI